MFCLAARDDAAVLMVFLILIVLVAALIVGAVIWSYWVSIGREIRRHLRSNCKHAENVVKKLAGWDRVNHLQVLESLCQQSGGKRVTVAYLVENLQRMAVKGSTKSGPNWETFASTKGKSIKLPTNAVYLIFHESHPVVACVIAQASNEYYDDGIGDYTSSGPTGFRLEVLALTRDIADAALERIGDLVREQSIYRGQTILLRGDSKSGGDFAIEFSDIPNTTRDDIVLPEDLLHAIERNVIGFVTHTETLRKLGRSVKHGVLFFGPPGVGKTLVTRYLTKQCPKHTIVILTGRNLHLLRESMMFARLLTPSIVILEDVDLIANERSNNSQVTVLQELLDELDGLGAAVECLVLMSTNRPDLLEPALAARPGRVDQTFELQLPNADLRRRLCENYSKGLNTTAIDWTPWIERTSGVSPAFIAEWLRRALLLAADRGEQLPDLKLQPNDLDEALREITLYSGGLTQRLLGSSAARME